MLSLNDFALAAYHMAMNLGPEVYLALMVMVILLTAMKYDDRKRAKHDADNQPDAPAK